MMELVKMASRASTKVVVVTVAVEQSLPLVGVDLQGRASSVSEQRCRETRTRGNRKISSSSFLISYIQFI